MADLAEISNLPPGMIHPALHTKRWLDIDDRYRLLCGKKKPTDAEVAELAGMVIPAKPVLLHNTYCPDCSSANSEKYTTANVFLFRLNGEPRVKCVQCILEWWSRDRQS